MDTCFHPPDVSSSIFTELLSSSELQWEATRTCYHSQDTGGSHGRTSNMGWPRDCASFILLYSIGGVPETGIILDVKTGLQVCHPLSPSRIPKWNGCKEFKQLSQAPLWTRWGRDTGWMWVRFQWNTMAILPTDRIIFGSRKMSS